LFFFSEINPNINTKKKKKKTHGIKTGILDRY
jgi:hypothetical protein